MKNLLFNRLLVISNSKESGNQFEFRKGLNLIKAKDNSLGKSTIVKLLLWTLGCEPTIDETWKSFDTQTIVEFSIGQRSFRVTRYSREVTIEEPGVSVRRFEKISGDFAIAIAEILEFKVLLPNKTDPDVLETPPPAYYFLPFYIDQEDSWTTPWNGFKNLAQYASWKRTVVKYHVGILPPEYFAIASEKYSERRRKSRIVTQAERINTAIDVYATYIPRLSPAITLDPDAFESMTEEIRLELRNLIAEEEGLLSNLAQAQSNLTFWEQQRGFASQIVSDLDLDYTFAVEQIDGDTVECPLCATVHQSGIVERADFLVEKEKAQNQLSHINQQIFTLKQRIKDFRSSTDIIRQSIDRINAKFSPVDVGGEALQVIEGIGGIRLQTKAEADLKEKLLAQSKSEEEIKRLEKEQKKTQTKKRISDINSTFSSTFRRIARDLKAETVSTSRVNTPTDYGKLREGGAADHTRLTLAYDLAIYEVINQYGSGVRSPLIIDTPNQQEQSKSNYESILRVVSRYVPDDGQLFLCALQNEHLDSYEQSAHVIELDSRKILQKSKYQDVRRVFDEVELAVKLSNHNDEAIEDPFPKQNRK